MTPRKPLTPLGRKWALSIHLIFVGLWFGAAIAMVLLIALRPSSFESPESLVIHCNCVKIIDDYIIIGSAGGSLVTGLFLSWKTRWGFFQWYWVAFKIIATIMMVCFGAAFLGPWINRTAEIAADLGLQAFDSPEYQTANSRALIFGSMQIGLLTAVVVISVFKPWGKIAKRPSL